MRRVVKGLLVGLAGFFLVATPRVEAVILIGSLTGSGLVTGGDWTDGTFSWIVTEDGGGADIWTYDYTFTSSGSPGLSHSIIEVSPTFTEDDLLDGTSGFGTIDLEGPDDFGPHPSNPGIPGTFFGVKFQDDALENVSGTTFQWILYTTRSPVCGDVYLKGGNDSFAYNAGFLSADPTIDLSDTDTCSSAAELYHTVVPDTDGPPPPPPPPNGNGVIPEPSSLLLLSSGLLGSLGFGVSRKRI